MGTIETVYYLSNNLTTHVVKGNVRSLDIIPKVKAFLSGTPTKFVIWDFTEGSIASIYAEDIELMARTLKKLAEARKDGKTALVFSDNLSYGIGRMFEAYFSMEKMPVEFQSFHSLKEARQWLGIKDEL